MFDNLVGKVKQDCRTNQISYNKSPSRHQKRVHKIDYLCNQQTYPDTPPSLHDLGRATMESIATQTKLHNILLRIG